MHTQQEISIGNLLLDLTNYRHGRQLSQKDARAAIIKDQGKKLVTLAEDIGKHGLNPSDLPMVVDANDDSGNYVVVEGNRRLTAILLLANPELAEGSPIYSKIKKLSAEYADSIPKVINCVVAPSKSAARTWIDRKHSNGLEGAGTEHWSAIAKARADVEAGNKRPELNVINFLLSQKNLDENLRKTLEGADFNLTNLKRLVDTKELQEAAGFEIQEGDLIAFSDKKWLTQILTKVVQAIANGEYDGQKFTVDDIYTAKERGSFAQAIVNKTPGKKDAKKEWSIQGDPVSRQSKPASKKASITRTTTSTEDQPTLIPKKFRLELPAGKINDIFDELKKLDATRYRHAVSVLFRVFLEISLTEFIKSHNIVLPRDKNNRVDDSLQTKLKKTLEYIKAQGIMNDNELKPINVAISNKEDFLSPNTLNAYVHGPWMNPDPLRLKLSWANVQPFIEKLWTPKSNAGQDA